MTKLLDITNMIVNYNINVLSIILMFVYSIPRFLELVIPMSIMLSVMLTFLRMSNDNEIVALKSGGISVYNMIPSVLIFSLIGCMLTAFMSIYGLPWGRISLEKLAFEVARSNIKVGLKERIFNNSFKDIILYVNKINNRDKTLIDVFIEDQRQKDIISCVVAPKGRLYSDPEESSFHLQLYDGTINQVNLKNRTANSIGFNTYEINLDYDNKNMPVKSNSKDEKEMSLAELSQSIKDAKKKDAQYYLTKLEYHKKFSIPFACIALGILAVPLGIQSKSAKKSNALGLGLAFFLIYYLMLSAGRVFGETGVYPPVIGMWVPNIVLGALGLYLLIQTTNDRSINITRSSISLIKKNLRKI